MSTYKFPHYKIFFDFIVERHAIYERRARGQSAPWTTDPILAEYRFCNVYRELDRVTQWIAKQWRAPNAKDPDVWLLMLIARVVNLPDTLQEMNFLGADGIEWKKAHFLSVMRDRKKRGQQVYGGAYIISTSGSTKEKAEYLADRVIGPMWKGRNDARPRKGERLASFHARLMQYNGMGSFMAAQILADLKYIEPLKSAEDWWTFASSGPGSRRGMSYLMGYDPATHWKEHEWRDALSELQDKIADDVHGAKLPRIHAQDLQNCLCEFSKYRRTQLGTGRPKTKFVPTL